MTMVGRFVWGRHLALKKIAAIAALANRQDRH
jgi:hypothetical protein